MTITVTRLVAESLPQTPGQALALFVDGIVLVLVVGLAVFFRYSLLGKAMRACASNPVAARLCGIRTSSLVTLSFFIAASGMTVINKGVWGPRSQAARRQIFSPS